MLWKELDNWKGSKMSDKPIIMVCNIPEKPLRTPKASDKREYSPFFNPERRPPPPDPLEMGNHPELMEMLFEAYRAVEEYAFDKAEGLRETESNKELDDYTLYEDTLLKVLDSFKITDLIEEACDIDKFCLLYTSPSPRDRQKARMPSSA